MNFDFFQMLLFKTQLTLCAGTVKHFGSLLYCIVINLCCSGLNLCCSGLSLTGLVKYKYLDKQQV